MSEGETTQRRSTAHNVTTAHNGAVVPLCAVAWFLHTDGNVQTFIKKFPGNLVKFNVKLAPSPLIGTVMESTNSCSVNILASTFVAVFRT